MCLRTAMLEASGFDLFGRRTVFYLYLGNLTVSEYVSKHHECYPANNSIVLRCYQPLLLALRIQSYLMPGPVICFYFSRNRLDTC